MNWKLKLVGTPCSYGKVPEKEEIFYEPKAKRRCDSINTEESSHSEEEDEDEERENFAEGVAKQVCGFVRYPSVLPINGKSREKTLQKLQEYGRDHCNYVRIGNSILQKKNQYWKFQSMLRTSRNAHFICNSRSKTLRPTMWKSWCHHSGKQNILLIFGCLTKYRISVFHYF